MKTLTILLASFVTAAAFGQTQFKLYNVKFKASELTPDGQFGPDTDHITEFFGAKTTNDLYDILGQYYTVNNMKNTKPLLNLYSSAKQPILDEINLRFYFENGFEILSNPESEAHSIVNEPNFSSFKDSFNNLYNLQQLNELRDFLYAEENRKFRIALEITRYVKIERQFDLTQTKIKSLSAGIQADINSIIKNSVNLSSSISTNISNIVKTVVVMNNANYYEIALHDNYVTIASIILKKYEQNIDALQANGDVFSQLFAKFLASGDVAIIVAADVLGLKVDYHKVTQLEFNLGATLTAEANLNEQEVNKIKAKIDALFKTTTSREFSMTSGVAFYNVRYGYTDWLEVGH